MPVISTRGAASACGFGFASQPPVSHVYTTWNPSDVGTHTVLSNGNLSMTSTTIGYGTGVRAKISKSSGMWYWEVTVAGSTLATAIGIGNSSADLNVILGQTSQAASYRPDTGLIQCNGSAITTVGTVSVGGVIGIELNFTTTTLTWTSGGSTLYSGTFSALGLSGGPFFPEVSAYTSSSLLTANFGASAFTYTVPTGANAGVY